MDLYTKYVDLVKKDRPIYITYKCNRLEKERIYSQLCSIYLYREIDIM